MSRLSSATSFFNRAFSSRTCLSSRARSGSSPPYFFFHRLRRHLGKIEPMGLIGNRHPHLGLFQDRRDPFRRIALLFIANVFLREIRRKTNIKSEPLSPGRVTMSRSD